MSTEKRVPKAPTRKHEKNGEVATTILSSKLDDRHAKLLVERARGQHLIADMEGKLENTRRQAQRVDGAIRVLEELIAEEQAE